MAQHPPQPTTAIPTATPRTATTPTANTRTAITRTAATPTARAARGFALGLALAATAAGMASPAMASERAHEHGVVTLNVVLDGQQLSIELDAPLDNLLGFERAPRTDAERQAAADVLARLRNPAQAALLLAPAAAAQCRSEQVEVLAPVLTSALSPAPGPAAPASRDGHADLEAHYTWRCAQPQALRSLDVGLWEAFRRIQRIDVQVAGPRGQFKHTLKRPTRSLPLQR